MGIDILEKSSLHLKLKSICMIIHKIIFGLYFFINNITIQLKLELEVAEGQSTNWAMLLTFDIR